MEWKLKVSIDSGLSSIHTKGMEWWKTSNSGDRERKDCNTYRMVRCVEGVDSNIIYLFMYKRKKNYYFHPIFTPLALTLSLQFTFCLVYLAHNVHCIRSLLVPHPYIIMEIENFLTDAEHKFSQNITKKVSFLLSLLTPVQIKLSIRLYC